MWLSGWEIVNWGLPVRVFCRAIGSLFRLGLWVLRGRRQLPAAELLVRGQDGHPSAQDKPEAQCGKVCVWMERVRRLFHVKGVGKYDEMELGIVLCFA